MKKKQEQLAWKREREVEKETFMGGLCIDFLIVNFILYIVLIKEKLVKEAVTFVLCYKQLQPFNKNKII